MTSDEIVQRLKKCAGDQTSAWYKNESQETPLLRFVDDVGVDAVPVLISEALKTSNESHTAHDAIVRIFRLHKDIPLEYVRAVYQHLRGKTGVHLYMDADFKYETNSFSFQEALEEVYGRLEPQGTQDELAAISAWKADKTERARRQAEFARREQERKAEFERRERERQEKEQRERERLASEALVRTKEFDRRRMERARRVAERRCVVCGQELSWFARLRRSEYHRTCFRRGGYVADPGESACYLPGD